MGRVGRLVFGVDWCFGNFYWDNFEEKMDICRLILFIPSCEFISILDIGKLNLKGIYLSFRTTRFENFSFFLQNIISVI